MRKLKTTLQSKNIYLILAILLSVYILTITKIKKYSSLYEDGDYQLTCTVISVKDDLKKLNIILDCDEKIQSFYYYKNKSPNILIGDIITVQGQLSNPENNKIDNTFNYKKYLYNNKIYKIFTIKQILKTTHSKNLLIVIKNKIKQRINNKYIGLFVLGDKSLLDDDIYTMYQKIGVAHLIALSGMHVSVIISILSALLFFIKKEKRHLIIIPFLIFFSYITGNSPSILRVIIMYVLSIANKKYDINLKPIKLLLITGFIMLIINPFWLYNTSFIYSFSSAFALVLTSRYKSNNYIVNIIKTSYFIMLMTLPITININYEINLILFIGNIILIPYVSFIILPLSLFTFIFLPFINIYIFFTNILEKIIVILNEIKFTTVRIPKLNIYLIIVFYLILLLYFYYGRLRILLLLVSILFFNNIKYKINPNLYIYFLDVGQGDSMIITSPYKRKIIMIDTGGNRNNSIIKNSINYMNSNYINKIDCLIITHGDYDHMGEAINLVNNFKVENVIFNCGFYNDLEQELIEVLEKKNIKYYSCIKELNIDKYKLQFLNTKEYDNENDNSSVIYFNYNNYKFLFMGDASVEREKDILEKYNLKDIDFLKVGHHGSNTSSSEQFINSINPKYSLISVGKNNRYGHPKDEVLETLKNSKIYRTDLDGSIEIKLNKNGYKIRTCPP